MTERQRYEERDVGQLIRRISIIDTVEAITAAMPNTTYQPLTCLWVVQQTGEVQEVYPFENGEHDEWTRYYHEEYDHYPPPATRGICYEFTNKGMEFALSEHLDSTLLIFLEGTGLDEDRATRQGVFGQTLDTLCREMHAVWFADQLSAMESAEKQAAALQKLYRGVRFGREQSP